MGRRKKYHTDEERQKANNEKVKQFYWRNKELLDAKAKAYYWRKKIELHIKLGELDKADLVREKAIQRGIERGLLIVETHENK